MSAQILDGKTVAAAIRAEVKTQVEEQQRRTGLAPRLVAVLVGEDPASKVYVRNKIAACHEAGIRSDEIRIPVTSAEGDLLAVVRRLNDDPDVDGILVQLPLPRHIDRFRVLLSIDPAKDVDGLHVTNAGRLAMRLEGLVPCTPAGVIEILDRNGLAIAGMRAVIIGRSEIVGRPLATLLMHRDATVTVCHSKTRDLPAVARQADILIAAIGHPAFVRGEHIRSGAIVVDVGINRVDDPDLVRDVYGGDPSRLAQMKERGFTLMGDVHWREAVERAAWITPVPGGIGPLTIACLLRNTVRASLLRRQPTFWA
jgi:methylenetetrahydrofolate dehydrogenase (NADP+) / methenyltetrahydrofolate cyclohydrolase